MVPVCRVFIPVQLSYRWWWMSVGSYPMESGRRRSDDVLTTSHRLHGVPFTFESAECLRQDSIFRYSTALFALYRVALCEDWKWGVLPRNRSLVQKWICRDSASELRVISSTQLRYAFHGRVVTAIIISSLKACSMYGKRRWLVW